MKKLLEFSIYGLPIHQQDFSVSRGKEFLIELLIPGLLFPFIVVKKCYLRSGVWLFRRFLEIIVKIIKDVFFLGNHKSEICFQSIEFANQHFSTALVNISMQSTINLY